jgi:predicted aspartyl protease
LRRADFELGQFELIRLPATVNATATTAVLDTGASYSIVVASLAGQAGVREIPEATGFGRGLHNREIPLTFGILDRLAFAGLELENIPVMVMPDDALLFETSRGDLPLPMVLGLHLLKEFTIRIDYDPSRLSLARADPKGPKTDPRQNLFYSRGRILARVSVNLASWSPFLLDTGSEATLMTSAGLARLRLPPSNKVYPKRVRGIGKARMEWGRIRRVSIGIDRFLLRFQDLIVREDDAASEDGILGASALRPFHVTIDFGRMRLILDEP